jgi:hypothetical protein
MKFAEWEKMCRAIYDNPDFAVTFAKEYARKVLEMMTDGPEKDAASELLPLIGTFKPGILNPELTKAESLYKSHLVEDESDSFDPPKCGWDNFYGLGAIFECTLFPWKASEESESKKINRIQTAVWEKLKP